MDFKDPTLDVKDIPVRFRGAYARWKKIKNTPLGERLWPMVQKGSKTKCWPFSGPDRAPKGYGIITLSSKPRVRWLTHRLAWVVTFGPIESGLIICHDCDNPICCNPSHLFIGTHKDNAQDREKKGRGNQPKGERHRCARLKERDVLAIRTLASQGFNYPTLAKMFSIEKSHVGGIVRRKKWKHI